MKTTPLLSLLSLCMTLVVHPAAAISYWGTNQTSKVFFDTAGEKPIYSINYDKEGKVESLSSFYYWNDDPSTSENESLPIKNTKQYRLLPAEKTNLTSAASDPAQFVPAASTISTNESKLKSRTYFDDGGLPSYSISYNKEGAVKSVTQFYYWEDNTNTVRSIQQYSLTPEEEADLSSRVNDPAQINPAASAIYTNSSKRVSRTFLDEDGRPIQSISFDGTGSNVVSVSRFILSPSGEIDYIDQYSLSDAQQTNLPPIIEDFEQTDAEISTTGISQRISRTRLDDEAKPEYSISFDYTGTNAVAVSRFIYNSTGELDRVDQFEISTEEQSYLSSSANSTVEIDGVIYTISVAGSGQVQLSTGSESYVSSGTNNTVTINGVVYTISITASNNVQLSTDATLYQSSTNNTVEINGVIYNISNTASNQYQFFAGANSYQSDPNNRVEIDGVIYNITVGPSGAIQLSEDTRTYESSNVDEVEIDDVVYEIMIDRPRRTSTTRFDENDRPLYSLSFDETGTNVTSLTRFILDENGELEAVDTYSLTLQQQADLSSIVDTVGALNTAASAIYGGTAGRTSRTRLNDDGEPMYSLSFNEEGSTVTTLSRFTVNAVGEVQTVDSFPLTPEQQTDLTSKLDNFTELDAAAAAINAPTTGPTPPPGGTTPPSP